MFMNVSKTAHEGQILAATWRAREDTDAAAALGEAWVGTAQGDLHFSLSSVALEGAGVLGCSPVTLPEQGWALRVDEVAFPVGAVAHRHTHTGRGWRHLVSGSLRIETEHGADIMEAGASWFEPENSPVRAVAMQSIGVTRFVRCMVIPQSLVGQSTFQLCDPLDAELPRLQMTHRHFDHIYCGDAL